jgi:hypothetical protein
MVSRSSIPRRDQWSLREMSQGLPRREVLLTTMRRPVSKYLTGLGFFRAGCRGRRSTISNESPWTARRDRALRIPAGSCASPAFLSNPASARRKQWRAYGTPIDVDNASNAQRTQRPATLLGLSVVPLYESSQKAFGFCGWTRRLQSCTNFSRH